MLKAQNKLNLKVLLAICLFRNHGLVSWNNLQTLLWASSCGNSFLLSGCGRKHSFTQRRGLELTCLWVACRFFGRNVKRSYMRLLRNKVCEISSAKCLVVTLLSNEGRHVNIFNNQQLTKQSILSNCTLAKTKGGIFVFWGELSL